MRRFRQERLKEVLKEELGKIIAREVEFDGSLATITDIDVSSDLENAVISVSIFPQDKAEEGLEILRKRQPWLQHLLAEKLRIKHMPKIAFQLSMG